MDPLFDLTGKRALITGASSGLGAHFATVLAERGARLALAARRVERLDDLAADLATEAITLELDVTDREQVGRAVEAVAEYYDGLDVVVNNAGIADGAPVLDVTAEQWDRILGTNLHGAWHVAQAGAAVMAAGDGGAIVNVASILGLRVAGASVAYATSKAGVVQMTKAMALDLARHGVRVNALAPGYVETDINRDFLQSEAGAALIKRVPQRRVGEPSDLDGALVLLASDASRYMTGAVVTVDGGHLCSSL